MLPSVEQSNAKVEPRSLGFVWLAPEASEAAHFAENHPWLEIPYVLPDRSCSFYVWIHEVHSADLPPMWQKSVQGVAESDVLVSQHLIHSKLQSFFGDFPGPPVVKWHQDWWPVSTGTWDVEVQGNIWPNQKTLQMQMQSILVQSTFLEIIHQQRHQWFCLGGFAFIQISGEEFLGKKAFNIWSVHMFATLWARPFTQ